MIAQPDRKSLAASALPPLKLERRMILIRLPEPVILASELLNANRESGVKFPGA